MARAISNKLLLEDLAEATGKPQTACHAFLDNLAAVITKRLQDGDAVVLPALAKFEPRDKPARQVRNPSTGETIEKSAHRAAVIKPVRELKESLDK